MRPKLTTEIIKQNFGSFDMILIFQNEIMRETLFIDKEKKPLLFALTLFEEANELRGTKLWEQISNGCAIGETLKKNGYRINKLNISKLKIKTPDWLTELTGLKNTFHECFAYELVYNSQKRRYYFATIIEIILDKKLKNIIKYHSGEYLEADKLNEALINIYSKSKIKKEKFIFFNYKD